MSTIVNTPKKANIKMAHYRITPLEKKSIEMVIELFRENIETGETQWFTIKETYRWGKGFIAEDMDVNLPYEGASEVYCRMDEGEYEGCELDDSCACYFEFDDSISEEEQEQIRELYYEGGASWVYDGEHNWQIEDDYVVVYGPYTVELVKEDGEVIEEVKLEPRPDPNTSWPFSKDFPKTSD